MRRSQQGRQAWTTLNGYTTMQLLRDCTERMGEEGGEGLADQRAESRKPPQPRVKLVPGGGGCPACKQGGRGNPREKEAKRTHTYRQGEWDSLGRAPGSFFTGQGVLLSRGNSQETWGGGESPEEGCRAKPLTLSRN